MGFVHLGLTAHEERYCGKVLRWSSRAVSKWAGKEGEHTFATEVFVAMNQAHYVPTPVMTLPDRTGRAFYTFPLSQVFFDLGKKHGHCEGLYMEYIQEIIVGHPDVVEDCKVAIDRLIYWTEHEKQALTRKSVAV